MYTIVKKEENGRDDCFDLTDSRDLKKTVHLIKIRWNCVSCKELNWKEKLCLNLETTG